MRAPSLIAAISMIVASSAAADGPSVTSGQEVDMSFASIEARLFAQGYEHPKSIDRSPTHVYAVSRDGTPVILRLDPQTGDILTIGVVRVAAE